MVEQYEREENVSKLGSSLKGQQRRGSVIRRGIHRQTKIKHVYAKLIRTGGGHNGCYPSTLYTAMKQQKLSTMVHALQGESRQRRWDSTG